MAKELTFLAGGFYVVHPKTWSVFRSQKLGMVMKRQPARKTQAELRRRRALNQPKPKTLTKAIEGLEFTGRVRSGKFEEAMPLAVRTIIKQLPSNDEDYYIVEGKDTWVVLRDRDENVAYVAKAVKTIEL